MKTPEKRVMKASEMIAQLQGLVEKYGDLDVNIKVWDSQGQNLVEEIPALEYVNIPKDYDDEPDFSYFEIQAIFEHEYKQFMDYFESIRKGH